MIDGYRWTRHGHWYGWPEPPDTAAYEARPSVAKCGGPDGGLCQQCASEAGYTMAEPAARAAAPRPSLGRHVLYRSFGSKGGEYASTDRVAIVTEVDEVDPLWVGLVVLNPTGMFFRSLADGGCHWSGRDKGGTWRWPT